MTQETKLGIFVLIGVFGLIISVLTLGDFQFQRRYDINILFDDIAGLPDKAKVKIAGVEVGSVKKITLVGNKAKVTVWIRHGIAIHRDARASIVATGIIGSKYLELTIGSENQPVLKDGDTIIGVNPVSFDKIIAKVTDKLDQLFSSFSSGESGNLGENLGVTMRNLREVTDTLRNSIAHQDQKITEIIDNVHSFTGDMAEITADNKEDIRITIQEIRSAAAKLDNVLAKLQSNDGTIGKLISDQQMGTDIKETFSDVKETVKQAKQVVRRLNLIETNWEYRLRYDTKNAVAHNDAGIRISPRPGKFYYLGVSNAGDTSDITNDPEKKNTIDVLLGKQFGAVQLFGGIMRSKGGIGMTVKPLYKWNPLSRFEFIAEGYDFGRTVPVGKAKINAGARYKPTNWMYVGAQVEDLYYTSSANLFMHLSFRDDDIAYILGLVGLAKY